MVVLKSKLPRIICKLGEILEYLRFSPYDIWDEMDQYNKEGLRYLFLQWVLGQTYPFLFALEDKNRLIVRILHSETKYAE